MGMNSSSAPPRLSPLTPGYQLDRYELLCPIAEGGMGAVWLARQRGKHGFQKLVAVKTILPAFLSEPDFRVLFLDEARLASRIDHPNVAQVLDLGEENDVLYLVIEWVDGDSLFKLAKTVSKKGLALPQTILLRVLSDACLGLHAAHEVRDDEGNHLGVVHRDVSPQNILVSTHGTSKVIDFGIAKARDRLTQETRMGVVKGKLQYMSPEQALGLAVDVRADIWAIGAVFYRIVTGKSPYNASNPVSTMELLKTGQLPEPLSAMPSVHPAVCKVITRALAPRAADRFATAAELHDALQTAMTEAGAFASAKDVQAFVATHLGERISARKRTIQVALEAAVHRDKLAAVLKLATLESTGTIAILDEANTRAEAPRQVVITERTAVTSVDTIEPPRDRQPVRRIWLALVLVVGIGSILGKLIFARTGTDVTPSSTVTKVVDPVVTSAPPPPPIETAIAPSTSAPAPSSTESTGKGVGPLPGTPRPRVSPRPGAASPRRVTGDSDGI